MGRLKSLRDSTVKGRKIFGQNILPLLLDMAGPTGFCVTFTLIVIISVMAESFGVFVCLFLLLMVLSTFGEYHYGCINNINASRFRKESEAKLLLKEEEDLPE